MDWKKFEVTKAGRLDKVLTDELNQSRNQVEQLIKEGLVKVNDKVVIKTGKKLLAGELVAYTFKEVVPKSEFELTLQKIDLRFKHLEEGLKEVKDDTKEINETLKDLTVFLHKRLGKNNERP